MNFVYLSPHFPPQYRAFPIALKRLGATVLGLADEPYEQIPGELKSALSEYYRVPDMLHYDQMVRAMGYLTHRYGKIGGIDSHNEFWLETEARLRTDFNIEGYKAEDIPRIKKKSVMKKVFEKSGLPAARGKVLRSLRGALAFAEEVGYPLVAKPDMGVGASHTYKITNPTEMVNLFKAGLPADFIFEEFIQGGIISFDGLADERCEPVFFTSHIFSQGIMETVNDDMDIFYYSVREIPVDLERAGRALLKAFRVQKRFFHFEFFRTNDHQLVPLEVNMRPPGGLTTDMFNYANDMDIYAGWANLIVNNRFDLAYERSYYCAYVGRKNNLAYAHNHIEIVSRFGQRVVHFQPIEGVFRGAIGDFGYLVRSTDLSEIFAMSAYIRQKA